MTWSKIVILVCFTIMFPRTIFCGSSIIIGPSDNQTIMCEERKCIPKCCDEGQYLYVTEAGYDCKNSDIKYDFNITVYDDYYYNEPVNETIRDLFYLVPGIMNDAIGPANITFGERSPFTSASIDYNSYLTKNGTMYLDMPNAYERWKQVEYFCVDYVLPYNETEELSFAFLLVFLDPSEVASDPGHEYYFYFLVISCVFLTMVLIVYLLLPELRNLGGLILMAYVTSLLFGFMLLAVVQVQQIETDQCINITASVYFFLLATFYWMNVMSIDIWWTFRGYAKARPIHRKGEHFKFLMYCLYAWGMPAAMTVGMVVVNESDLSAYPWIIKPMIPSQGCFIDGGQKLLYLYVPMLILIVCNWIFFLMTAYNIRRLMQGCAVLNTAAAGNPTAHRQQRNRLFVYLKLSVIMGINWILEVVSSFDPKNRLWDIFDTYNLLIGFAIFLIFVCKKKIFKKLLARYYQLRSSYFGGPRPTRTLTKSSTSSSTLESNLSQEIPLQVSSNPMPEEKRGGRNRAVFNFCRTNYK